MRKEDLTELTDKQVAERYQKLMKYLDRKGYPYIMENGQILVPITHYQRIVRKGGEKVKKISLGT